MRISTDQAELFVAVDGPPDAAPLLALHGITSCGLTWEWAVADLCKDWRVLRLDFRGHGRSGRVPGGYQPSGYLADAVAVVEEVARQPVVVIGHSLGGLTAAALAQQHPYHVRAVVLEDPPLWASHDERGGRAEALMTLFGLLRDAVPAIQKAAPSVEEHADFLTTTQTVTGVPAKDVFTPDTFEVWAHSQLWLDPRVLDPVLNGHADSVYDPTVPLGVPGLVLAADPSSPDTVLGEASTDRLRAVNPDLDIRVVRGAGHAIHDEINHRETVRAAMLEFLAGLRG